MSKKINQLDAASSSEAKNDSWLFALADPIDGVAKRMTVAQAKEVYGTKRTLYKGLGTEGQSLVIPELSGRQVLFISRGMGIIYEVGTDPESDEYTWNDTTIGLGADINLDEKFIILHRTY